jgi:hypothetical protein
VGVHTIVKRLHETSRLKSIDEKREKLKVRRMIDGIRLEVLHLSAVAAAPETPDFSARWEFLATTTNYRLTGAP